MSVKTTKTKSTNIPKEILCNIFRYLDSTSLSNAALVNYRWKSICQEDIVLRRRIHEHLQLTNRKSRIQAIYDKDVTVNFNKHRISQIPSSLAKKLMLCKPGCDLQPLAVSSMGTKSNPCKRSTTRPMRMATTMKTTSKLQIGGVPIIFPVTSLPVFHSDIAPKTEVLSIKSKKKYRDSTNSSKYSLFQPDSISTRKEDCGKTTIDKPALLYPDVMPMKRPSTVVSSRSVGQLSSLALSLSESIPQKKKVRIHPIGPTFLLMLKRKPDDLQLPSAKRILL